MHDDLRVGCLDGEYVRTSGPGHGHLRLAQVEAQALLGFERLCDPCFGGRADCHADAAGKHQNRLALRVAHDLVSGHHMGAVTDGDGGRKAASGRNDGSRGDP